MALYPAGKVPQYHFYCKTGRRVGLRPILALLKSLLVLIKLGRRLKPSRRLYPFLLGVYKLRVRLWLISLGLHIFWPKRKRKGGGEKKKGGKGGGKRKKKGSGGKSGGGIKGKKKG